MYAIIKTGGKQYRAEEGKILRVEKLPEEKSESVVFEEVLLVNDGKEVHYGRPYVAGCKVEGRVLAQGRTRKIIVFKFKAKKNYRRKQGHRQPFSDVLISKIAME
ncbi:MAG: 50S ribosomal protein L21 [Bacillota bacterium]